MSGKGTWLHESDGDLNPGWAIVGLFSTIGAIGCGVAFAIGLKNPAAATVVIPSAFGFIAFVIVAAASMVVSIARAKVLNGSKVLGALSTAIAARKGGPDVFDREDGDAETMVERD